MEQNTSSQAQDASQSAVEQLRFLCASIRSKKDPSGNDSIRFTKLWMSAASAGGITSDLASILLSGASISKAQPLYLLARQHPEEGYLHQFYQCDVTKSNLKGATLKITCSLLGFELVQPSSLDDLEFVINELPNETANKEGRRWGKFDQTVQKFLIGSLDGKGVSPEASDCPATPSLRNALLAPLDAIKSKPKLSASNLGSIKQLEKWLATSSRAIGHTHEPTHTNPAQVHAPISESSNVAPVNRPGSPDGARPGTTPLPQPVPTAAVDATPTQKIVETPAPPSPKTEMVSVAAAPQLNPTPTHQVNSPNTGSEERPTVEEAPTTPREATTTQDNRIADLLDQLLKEQKGTQALVQQLQSKALETGLSVRRVESQLAAMSEASGQQQLYINNLKGRISQLEEQLAQTKKESQEREDMIELLSSSRQSSESEALVRLADKLRIDYQDYQEAADLPMNADLGENMRLQLEDVFNVLKDSGIDL